MSDTVQNQPELFPKKPAILQKLPLQKISQNQRRHRAPLQPGFCHHGLLLVLPGLFAAPPALAVDHALRPIRQLRCPAARRTPAARRRHHPRRPQFRRFGQGAARRGPGNRRRPPHPDDRAPPDARRTSPPKSPPPWPTSRPSTNVNRHDRRPADRPASLCRRRPASTTFEKVSKKAALASCPTSVPSTENADSRTPPCHIPSAPPSSVSTHPPAASSTACGAAVSHSIVRPSRG